MHRTLKRLVITGLMAAALPLTLLSTTAASAATQSPGAASAAGPGTFSGPMTRVRVGMPVIPGKAGATAVPEGRGVSPGDCGTAYLRTTGGNKFLLILDSSQGVIGTGTYQAFTDGFGELPFFGGISGHDSIVWVSGWKTIWDAGLWPNIITAEGWVTTARAGFCFFIVSAPAY